MIKTLIGIRLRALAFALGGKQKSGKGKTQTGGRLALMICLYAFLALMFAFFSLSLAIVMAPVMISAGLDALYFSLFMIGSFTVVFLFSIFETKSELFECRDNELLLAMPIRPREIILARIFTVLIYNYAECAVVFFPATAAYLFFGGSPFASIGAFFVFLLLPLFATALSSALGFLVARIAKKMKNNSLVTTLISLAFLALYLFGYTALMDGLEKYIDGIAGGSVTPESPVLLFIGGAALLQPLPFLALLALSLGGSALAFLLISRSYFRIVTDTTGAKHARYREKRVKQGTPFTALVKKELFRYVSSATYMLNSGIGLLFELGISVYFAVRIQEARELVGGVFPEGGADGLLPILGILILTFFSTCTFISGCSLSLEGKAFPMLRVLPIPTETVLLAKTVPHLIIALPFTVISAILLAVTTQAAWYYVIFLFLTPTAACLFCALFGMVMNVAFPKFDYVSEAQVIKQSAAMFICTFGQMLLAVLVSAVVILLTVASMGLLAVGAVTALFLALSAVMYIVLVGPSARRYEKL